MEVIMMNDFDEKIKKVVKKEIEKPLSYEYAIKNVFACKQARKRKLFSLRIATTVACLLTICTCVMATSYIIYEKVWKDPVKYEIFEDKLNADIIKEKNDKEKVNTKEAVDKKQIVIEANKIMKGLNYDIIISENEIQIPAERDNYYFYIEKENIILVFDIDGKLRCFTDNIRNSDVKEDIVSTEKATEISESIMDIIGQTENYVLVDIAEEESYLDDSFRKEWCAQYNQLYGTLKNEYNTILIDFYVTNEKVNVSRVIVNESNYRFDNNEVIIDEKTAIDIAKEVDRKISLLDIASTDIELAIKPINSFVYAQLNSLGECDELVKEKQENEDIVIYDAYNNENVLRKVWNVKFKYVLDSNKYRNYQEYWGREYYIDVSTGEIIGGSWGE